MPRNAHHGDWRAWPLMPAAALMMTAATIALAVPAHAQTVSLAPSLAVACMTPPLADRGAPVYPPELLERKDGGTVRVELVFTGPDRAPAMRVLSDQSFDGFVNAVRAHVATLRVPCLVPGAEPVRISQTFDFRPDDGRPVLSLPPVDEADAERLRQSACLTRITPGTLPDYPSRSRQNNEEGSFLVRLNFTDPAAAPTHEIIAGPSHRHLRRALDDFVPGFRLPCLKDGPLSIQINFQYKLDGGRRTLIDDMALTRFLSAAKSLPPAEFDFNNMGCPFDLRVFNFQPFSTHSVWQIGEAREDRRDFINWLAGIEIRMSPQQQLNLLGAEFTVSVPCGQLSL